MQLLKSKNTLALCVGAALMIGCSDTPLDPPDPTSAVPPSAPPPVVPPPPPVRGGPAALYISNANGSDPVFLVAGERPAWSPDSRRIAFHKAGEIHVIDTDGSNLVTIAPGSSPTWSPDGKRIAYANDNGIAIVSADGKGDPVIILRHDFRTDTWKEGDMGVGQPTWSPDGKRIAFAHLGDGDITPGQVFVMNADGSDPRLLTSNGGFHYAESDPAWSPDGFSIALWSYGHGIAVVAANGGTPRSIYRDFPTVAYGARPTWSADGRALLFTHGTGSPQASVWRISLAGPGSEELIRNAFAAASSPDGTRIVYVRR